MSAEWMDHFGNRHPLPKGMPATGANPERWLLPAAPHFRITISTGVVHHVPCIRMPIEDRATREWEPHTKHQRLCRHSLPNGLEGIS